jgi:hypothetical protein
MDLSIFQESFRKLVSVAHRFVSGDASFMEFYYACAAARSSVRGVSLDQRVSDLVNNWSSLAERCRNEWGTA